LAPPMAVGARLVRRVPFVLPSSSMWQRFRVGSPVACSKLLTYVGPFIWSCLCMRASATQTLVLALFFKGTQQPSVKVGLAGQLAWPAWYGPKQLAH
jgi:hypothetical protein